MSEFDWIPPIRVKMNAKPKAIPMPDWCKKRYQDAHDLSFSAIIKKDGLNFNAKIPDTNKANGLTLAIVNFINWHGFRATRISSAGRVVKGKYIDGQTRKGSADISSTIKGKSYMFEVKVGKDKPSEAQLLEQQKEIKAGGNYYFIKSFEQFLTIYDTI